MRYDVKAIYDLVKNVYGGEAVIPLNKRNTKALKLLSSGNPVCEAGLAMHKDGKTSDNSGGLRQKYCCPFRQSKTGCCPCNHKNWNNGKKNRGCTKYHFAHKIFLDRGHGSLLLEPERLLHEVDLAYKGYKGKIKTR